MEVLKENIWNDPNPMSTCRVCSKYFCCKQHRNSHEAEVHPSEASIVKPLPEICQKCNMFVSNTNALKSECKKINNVPLARIDPNSPKVNRAKKRTHAQMTETKNQSPIARPTDSHLQRVKKCVNRKVCQPKEIQNNNNFEIVKKDSTETSPQFEGIKSSSTPIRSQHDPLRVKLLKSKIEVSRQTPNKSRRIESPISTCKKSYLPAEKSDRLSVPVINNVNESPSSSALEISVYGTPKEAVTPVYCPRKPKDNFNDVSIYQTPKSNECTPYASIDFYESFSRKASNVDGEAVNENSPDPSLALSSCISVEIQESNSPEKGLLSVGEEGTSQTIMHNAQETPLLKKSEELYSHDQAENINEIASMPPKIYTSQRNDIHTEQNSMQDAPNIAVGIPNGIQENLFTEEKSLESISRSELVSKDVDLEMMMKPESSINLSLDQSASSFQIELSLEDPYSLGKNRGDISMQDSVKKEIVQSLLTNNNNEITSINEGKNESKLKDPSLSPSLSKDASCKSVWSSLSKDNMALSFLGLACNSGEKSTEKLELAHLDELHKHCVSTNDPWLTNNISCEATQGRFSSDFTNHISFLPHPKNNSQSDRPSSVSSDSKGHSIHSYEDENEHKNMSPKECSHVLEKQNTTINDPWLTNDLSVHQEEKENKNMSYKECSHVLEKQNTTIDDPWLTNDLSVHQEEKENKNMSYKECSHVLEKQNTTIDDPWLTNDFSVRREEQVKFSHEIVNQTAFFSPCPMSINRPKCLSSIHQNYKQDFIHSSSDSSVEWKSFVSSEKSQIQKEELQENQSVHNSEIELAGNRISSIAKEDVELKLDGQLSITEPPVNEVLLSGVRKKMRGQKEDSSISGNTLHQQPCQGVNESSTPTSMTVVESCKEDDATNNLFDSVAGQVRKRTFSLDVSQFNRVISHSTPMVPSVDQADTSLDDSVSSDRNCASRSTSQSFLGFAKKGIKSLIPYFLQKKRSKSAEDIHSLSSTCLLSPIVFSPLVSSDFSTSSRDVHENSTIQMDAQNSNSRDPLPVTEAKTVLRRRPIWSWPKRRRPIHDNYPPSSSEDPAD